MLAKKLSFLYSAWEGTINSLSIRYTLPLMIITPLLVGVGASSWFSFQAGKQEIEHLVGEVSKKSTTIIELKVHSYLEKNEILMQSQLAAIQSGDLKLDNFAELQRSFWHQVQQSNLFTNIYFGNERGEYIAVEKEYQQTLLKFRDESTNQKRNVYQLDFQGNRAKLLKSAPNEIDYNPRDRPWYKVAKKAEKLVWTPIYNSSATDALMISLVVPILEQKTGKFQGALSTDVTLGDLSDFLRKLSISTTGKAFILERSGNLVATSSQEPPFQVVNGQQERRKVTQSQEAVIQGTGQYLFDKFKTLEAIEKQEQFSFTFGGNSHVVEVAPIKDNQGLNWLLVVVIPKADFTQNIDAYTRFTIILSLAIAGGGVIFGLLMVRWINQPIQDLYQAAKAIELEQFDALTLEKVASRGDEFGGLGKVFLAMAQVIYSREQNLKKMLANLPNKTSQNQNSKRLAVSTEQLDYWEDLMVESQKIRQKFDSFPESKVLPNQLMTLQENIQREIKE
ncbi:PDC sensor domain-containing protein [Microcoleus sp. OTE_8_concoct_300]|uniref:PDC sensor domain-containing protein n=1 Tax=Microcoleus sp. OTE_8_concoct_300 TaxID=2964710 RepID=UPI00403F9F7B